jgi:hypothetical protein
MAMCSIGNYVFQHYDIDQQINPKPNPNSEPNPNPEPNKITPFKK